MVAIDILIISIFAIFTILGIWKGIIGSIFKIAGIVSGVILAFLIYEDFAFFLSSINSFFKEDSTVSYILAFLIILISTIILFLLGAKLITSILKILKIKWLDNLIGGLFGFSIAFIINSGIIFGAKTLHESDLYPQFKNSLSYDYMLPLIIEIKGLIAERDSLSIDDFLNVKKVKKEINKKVDDITDEIADIEVKKLLPDSLKLKNLKK